MNNFSEHVSFIWSIAEILRGNYKQSEYGKVVLPFTVLRRLDCVLESSKEAVLKKAATLPEGIDSAMAEVMLNQASGHNFYNTSQFTFRKLLDDPDNIAANLKSVINSFSDDAKEIFVDKFELPIQIARLDKDNLLYLVVQKFAKANLHPDVVDNTTMGYIFEELIRRFSEQSNETAGEHFTPREVIRLMVNLLFAEDSEALTQKGVIRKLYDPACGTGGMLSEAEKYFKELNPNAHLEVYGQELNDESFAICKSDMMIKGQNPKNIKSGNSFSEDGLKNETFDYMLSNPPFGVDWKKVEGFVRSESEESGYDGRFGAGLPRISDGSLLFVQHMISKIAKSETPSRIAVVLNAASLATGDAGSGESEIRRWIIENDWLEAVVSLPEQLFYNTDLTTYIWIITNKKLDARKGKIQLIDASKFYKPLRKKFGDKRRELGEDDITAITELFHNFNVCEHSKIYPNSEFCYQSVTVNTPVKKSYYFGEGSGSFLSDSKFLNKNLDLKSKVIESLSKTNTEFECSNSLDFSTKLKDVLAAQGILLSSQQFKSLVEHLSIDDPNGEVIYDSKGRMKSEKSKKFKEKIGIDDSISDYLDRYIKPFTPEVWIEPDSTSIGYEILYTKYFFEFKKFRDNTIIDKEVKKTKEKLKELIKAGLK